MPDDYTIAKAHLDQMAAWYEMFAEFLNQIQNTLTVAGVNPDTVSVIVAQQHAKLIDQTED